MLLGRTWFITFKEKEIDHLTQVKISAHVLHDSHSQGLKLVTKITKFVFGTSLGSLYCCIASQWMLFIIIYGYARM